MSRKLRVPKKGLVYLLQSDCGRYGKYGASTNLKNRLYRINKDNPFNCKYTIIKFAYSIDIYNLENEYKYKLWHEHIGMNEFFYFNETFTANAAKEIFEQVCLKEGAICS